VRCKKHLCIRLTNNDDTPKLTIEYDEFIIYWDFKKSESSLWYDCGFKILNMQ
jgi:hypothetical protein